MQKVTQSKIDGDEKSTTPETPTDKEWFSVAMKT
jgi:hypothetical protein